MEALDQTSSAFSGLYGRGVDMLVLGGPVAAVLLVLSVLAGMIIFVKIVQFWPVITGRDGALAGAVAHARAGHMEGLGAMRRPAAQVAAYGLELGQSLKEADKMHACLEDCALSALAQMRRHLRVLEIIAQIAPLLGLLGTILGMIEAFKVIEGASGEVDPSALAGGIWTALLTTAAGLAVAIPVSVFLQWLEGVVARERRLMEHIITLITAGAPGLDEAVVGEAGYGVA